jgi:hypothetical protein
LLVVLGDLIQQGVTQSDYSVTGMTLAVGTITLMTVLVSYLSFRFRRLRPLLDGEPIVMVQNGKVLDRNLKRRTPDRRGTCDGGAPPANRFARPHVPAFSRRRVGVRGRRAAGLRALARVVTRSRTR